ncbi:MAG: NAD-dependent protein deacylase [Rhodocyclaceae bacterium]
MNSTIERVAAMIEGAQHIAVLTGAGMSTESGIPDFRSAKGLFTANRSFAEVVSIDYFLADPVGFWKAFREIFRIKLAGHYQPNAGHEFLAWLESRGKRVSVLTQNIDGLHTQAGSHEVLELHGTLMTAHCLSCGEVYHVGYVQDHEVPECRECGEIIKPDVVLYGEAVPLVERAFRIAARADLLLVMGSSLEVGPVNLIPAEAAHAGVPAAIINLTSTAMDRFFDARIEAKIGDACTALREKLED